MYKVILPAVIIIFLSISDAWSQNMTWGMKGGLNIGTPYMKPEEGSSGAPGIGPRLGAFVRHRFNEHLYLQIEMLYSVKGGEYKTPVSGDTIYEEVIFGDTFLIPTYYNGWVEGEFGNVYLDFPIMARYMVSERFHLMAGPQVSYLLKGKNKGTADIKIGEDYSTVEDEPFDESEYINNWDYSLMVGGSYETYSGLNFDLGFSAGLRSIFEDTYDKIDKAVRNMYLSATIGYRFGTNRSQSN
jgi:hypothetical protein